MRNNARPKQLSSPTTTVSLRLPVEAYRLEEINIPPECARRLAGRIIEAEILPEQRNDYHPLQARFTDDTGRSWNVPRHWHLGLDGWTTLDVGNQWHPTRECHFIESLHLPTAWDLVDINIPYTEAKQAASRETQVMVHVRPNEETRVYWHDSSRRLWRIPHDWRRRRIRLPGFNTLAANRIDLDLDIAEQFANRVVSVNYHPGSLCCLDNGYRFRDEFGNRWEIGAEGCVFVGFGSEGEALDIGKQVVGWMGEGGIRLTKIPGAEQE